MCVPARRGKGLHGVGGCMGDVLLCFSTAEASTAWPGFHLSDKCLWQHSCAFGGSLAISVSGEANLKITV